MEGVEPVSGVLSPRVVTASGRCDTTVAQNLGGPTRHVFPAGHSLLSDDWRGTWRCVGGSGHVLLSGRGDVHPDQRCVPSWPLADRRDRSWCGTAPFEGSGCVAMGGVEVRSGCCLHPGTSVRPLSPRGVRSPTAIVPARCILPGTSSGTRSLPASVGFDCLVDHRTQEAISEIPQYPPCSWRELAHPVWTLSVWADPSPRSRDFGYIPH